MCSGHVGLGTCCKGARFSMGCLPHEEQGKSSEMDAVCLGMLKRARGAGDSPGQGLAVRSPHTRAQMAKEATGPGLSVWLICMALKYPLFYPHRGAERRAYLEGVSSALCL